MPILYGTSPINRRGCIGPIFNKIYVNLSENLWVFLDILNFFYCFFSLWIFIKPDKGTKSFTGYCPDMFEFEMDMKSIFKGMKSDDLIILSEKKQLPEYEYRFYIINNEICTYSSYSWVRNDHREVPKGAIEYVKQIIPRIKLTDEFEDPITSYTLDIVYSDDIEPGDSIDMARAISARDRALDKLQNSKEPDDIKIANLALKRALARIDAKNGFLGGIK